MSLTFDSARIPNPHLTEDHLAWRDALRRFIDKEIMPYAEDWDEAGHIPIELWPKAAEVGLLGAGYPEQYGGMETDSWHNWIINEELSRVGVGGLSASLMVHGIGLPPVINWGTEEMKAEIAPPVLRGESWISLGITEPGGGSDVASLKTTAVRDGDHYIVNGSKTYITGGMRANYVSTAVRTGGEGATGVSMLLIPTDAEGFSRTPLDKKMGWWASDTATLYFDNVRVPVSNLIGQGESGLQSHHDELQFGAHGHGRLHGGLWSRVYGRGRCLGHRASNLRQASGGPPGYSAQDCYDEAEAQRDAGLHSYVLRSH